MIDIAGYSIEEKIYESWRTEVYRGFRQSDNQPVIFKAIKSSAPTADEVTRLKSEFQLLKMLEEGGEAVTLGMEYYADSPVLVSKDLGGAPLLDLLQKERLPLKVSLDIAIRVTGALGDIHRKGVIHKDINPRNILWNPKTRQARIIDFGLATTYSRENLAVMSPNRLEGTLAYISPEQTGRMNRPLDYRSDFYSLGVTFYRMFTGRMPFEAVNPLELVHSHIAKIPLPPHEVNKGIPAVISRLIIKLMAKAAEDRYQSIHGLKSDLTVFQERLNSGESVYFEVGRNDVSEKFQVPNKLYGRENETARLIDQFNRVTFGRKAMFLFSGMPGIGKSALISEIHKPIVEKRSYFCSGKYDQYKRSIPYSAIIQAFGELLKQTLAESEEDLSLLKKEILAAVGAGGQILIDVISEVELVIGRQPEVQELPPAEAQNRFHLVFRNFVNVFAQKTHPLVLSLDDLQWADNASLELIRVLLEDSQLSYFFFIGAYRDNEVDEGHPFALMLEKLDAAGVPRSDINVAPLNEEHIAQLTADTLNSSPRATEDLARLLLQKTGGNPFFLREYLKILNERELIRFDRSPGESPHWTWDVPRIQQAGITDNVVELMAEKVDKLPDAVSDLLKIACCMGSETSLTSLAAVCGESPAETLNRLKEAIDQGILILVENNLNFVHDRVWEATYSLIDDNTRRKLHHSIGKKMLEEARETRSERGDMETVPDDMLFDIADQWNRAQTMLDEEEQDQLRLLNFLAGQKAKASTAYAPAVNFFRRGAELFGPDPWRSRYDFTLRYYMEWAEAEYLARNINEAETQFHTVLKNAKDLMERVRIHSIQIDHYITQTQYAKALDVGVKALKELGIPMPAKPGKLSVVKELLNAKRLLGKRKIKDLVNQPEMKDQKKVAAMDIMLKCVPASIIANPIFTPIFIMKMTNLTLKYGNSPKSPYSFGSYGAILSDLMGDIENGYDFGKVALQLADRYDQSSMKCKVNFVAGFGGAHVKEHYRDLKQYFTGILENGRDAGDFVYMGYGYSNYGGILIFSGENLDSIRTNFFEKHHHHISNLQQPHATAYFNLWYQAVLNLLGQAEDIMQLNGAVFNEDVSIPVFKETRDNTGMAQYYIIKQYLAYLSEDYARGVEFSREAEKLYESQLGLSTVAVSHFFHALHLAAHYPVAAPADRRNYLRKLKTIEKKYRKWGEHNPHNHRHRHRLIAAELGRITGKSANDLVGLYSEAGRMAADNGIHYEAAIAAERTADYYLSLGEEKAAAAYLWNALYGYQRWGAILKVKALEAAYPDWLSKDKQPGGRMIENITITSSSTGGGDALDLETIIKASNTIAREIKLGDLLQQMMHIVIENAGAQKGSFLLAKDGEWFIEAEGSMEQADVKILQSVPIAPIGSGMKSLLLPTTIIKYVERTGETVVLNDAAQEGNFTQDVYIKTQKPRSVLCMPFLNQGKLAGILYMENNLSPGAFTQERLSVLLTLSSQIAISIDNARMYRDLDELNKNLEHMVQDRTEEVRQKSELILDSIRYSRKIQTAVLPLEETLKDVLPSHFIIFQPRDIVSGDFYWFTETESSIFFAVADCTGHGVPGALLSMMGDIFLKEIITTDHVQVPAEILRELHKKVRTHLKQEDKGAKTMDGMDMAVCRFEKGKNKVYFAGAKRPLIIVRNSPLKDTETGKLVKIKHLPKVETIRGDRKSIGGRQKEINRTYTNHDIDVKKGDMLYLSSDGYIDQPNLDMKRYGSTRLRAFLARIAHLPVERQKDQLLAEWEGYRESEKQGDDITIAGIRIG